MQQSVIDFMRGKLRKFLCVVAALFSLYCGGAKAMDNAETLKHIDSLGKEVDDCRAESYKLRSLQVV